MKEVYYKFLHPGELIMFYKFPRIKLIRSLGTLVNCVHPGYVISDMTHGAGNVTPAAAAEGTLGLALGPGRGGLYLWHNGRPVPWDGPDPRGYIDGKL